MSIAQSILRHAAAAVPILLTAMPIAWLHAEDTVKPIITKAAAANRISSIPSYVQTWSTAAENWDFGGGESIDWLDIGLISRARWEYRDNDYRTGNLLSEDVLYGRSLFYLGVKEVLDPLRMAIEIEDSRRFFSDRPKSGNETNHAEILQAYAELYFADAVVGEPVSVRLGRMSFDAGDRRLLSRNRFRNTITAFDGVRLRFGDDDSSLEIDSFAMMPVARDVSSLDQSSSDSWFYGVNAYLRGNSPNLIMEPYWYLADQQTGKEKHLHTTGMHVYGLIADSQWDYDANLAGQWGEVEQLDHRAWAAHVEAGYTWSQHPWKPRLGGWLDYASGDRDPGDDRSGRFDSLFGDSWSHYGFSSYFIWRNQIEPALRLAFQPAKDVKCEVFFRSAWLASESDAWPVVGRVDPQGQSGRHVGEEVDFRVAWKLRRNLEIEAVYSQFIAGGFVKRTGAAPDTHFGFVAATLRF